MTYDFSELGADEGDAPFPGTAVLFDPDLDDCTFVIYVDPVNPTQVSKMTDFARSRRGVDSAKFNEQLVGRVVKGWTGLTPEMLRDCRLYNLNDAGVEKVREKLKVDGHTEMPYTKAQAAQLMASSLRFAARVDELGGQLDALQAAREAYEKKASRRGSGTGTGAATSQGRSGPSS